MSLDQTGRLIRMVQGPLGPDEVSMTGFSGREAISRLFSFRLEFISTRLDLRPGEIIGKDVTIELDRRDSRGAALEPRYFHGYINRFAAGQVVSKDGGLHKYRHYRAEMVPWLWFLTQTARCYLFFPEKEDKTIYEVIEAVFNRAKSDLHIDPANDLKGIADLKKRKVKHCVQYRETDFDFVSRTLERYGVFYYFKFENGKHTLVLDMKKNYPKCEEAKVIYPRVTGTQSAEDHITEWQHDYEFVSGKWTYTDYNFEKPSTSLKADAPRLPSMDLPPADKYEIYDYPGDYAEKSEGESDAKVRQEEEEVSHNTVHGSSVCRSFTPGHTFKLIHHPDEDSVTEQGHNYLLTSVDHSASQPTEDTQDTATTVYNNRFTCIPDSVQFRPERISPVPQISGVQTAVVVGPSGELIHTDKYGRIKVQFHWDREGKKDGNSSCWVRVSQNWGGKNWGGTFIPHVGQEVIVDFLEGDPDQPIVTGRVYNAEQMPPLELPANKTKSAIRDHGGNEIIMEGADGKQQMRLYSPTHNTTMTLGNSLTVSTESFAKWLINQDWIGQIDGDQDETVLGNKKTFVAGGDDTTIGGSKSETVLSGVSEMFIGGKVEKILGSETKIVAPNVNEVIGGIGTRIHFGLEITRSPQHIELSAARRAEQAAAKQELLGTMDRKVGTCRDQLGSLMLQIAGDCREMIGTLNQQIGKLQAQVGDLKLCAAQTEISGGKVLLQVPTVDIHGDLIVTGKGECWGTFVAKSIVKLG